MRHNRTIESWSLTTSWASESAAALPLAGRCGRARVRHGLVLEEVLEEVQSEDYDLVVIGAYRGQGWQRILLDDPARRIVVELDRPVLVGR